MEVIQINLFPGRRQLNKEEKIKEKLDRIVVKENLGHDVETGKGQLPCQRVRRSKY